MNILYQNSGSDKTLYRESPVVFPPPTHLIGKRLACESNCETGWTSVYKNAIDDVIRNVREEFLNEAVDLEVLEDLRQIWLNKLSKSGAVNRPAKPDPPPRPVTTETTKQSSRQQTHNIPKPSTHALPPPLVPVQNSNPMLLPSLSQPPSLIPTPVQRDPSASTERETITVIHHAPPRTQATPPTTAVTTTPSQSTQPSSVMLPQGMMAAISAAAANEGSSTGGTSSVPSLLQPSLSSLQQATLQQGMVPIQTTQGTMLVPLSSFVALQMRQQQAVAAAQGSKSTPSTSNNSTQDSNKDVHQIDGFPPLLDTSFNPHNIVQTCDFDSSLVPSHVPLGTLVLSDSQIACKSNESANCDLSTSLTSNELPADVFGEQTETMEHCSNEVLTAERSVAPKKLPKKRKNFPRPGDTVEFVFEHDDSDTIDQIDGSTRGSWSRGQRSEFIVQVDGGPDGSSSEDDSDLDDDSSEDDLGDGSDAADDDPLNSDDDVVEDTEENKAFDTNDTIVCLWEKVYRVRTKWKFLLKDGIMHLGGFDYVFQKGTGEADW